MHIFCKKMQKNAKKGAENGQKCVKMHKNSYFLRENAGKNRIQNTGNRRRKGKDTRLKTTDRKNS